MHLELGFRFEPHGFKFLVKYILSLPDWNPSSVSWLVCKLATTFLWCSLFPGALCNDSCCWDSPGTLQLRSGTCHIMEAILRQPPGEGGREREQRKAHHCYVSADWSNGKMLHIFADQTILVLSWKHWFFAWWGNASTEGWIVATVRSSQITFWLSNILLQHQQQ